MKWVKREYRENFIYRASNNFHVCFYIIFVLHFKLQLNQKNSKLAVKKKDSHINF